MRCNCLDRAIYVLFGGTRKHVDVYRLCRDTEEMQGATLIHGVLVWGLLSPIPSCTSEAVHVCNHNLVKGSA